MAKTPNLPPVRLVRDEDGYVRTDVDYTDVELMQLSAAELAEYLDACEASDEVDGEYLTEVAR